MTNRSGKTMVTIDIQKALDAGMALPVDVVALLRQAIIQGAPFATVLQWLENNELAMEVTGLHARDDSAIDQMLGTVPPPAPEVKGTMVALVPDAADTLAVGDVKAGELHLTLAYLGKEIDNAGLTEAMNGVVEACNRRRCEKIRGVVNGIARYGPPDEQVWIATVDSAGADELHSLITEELRTRDVWFSQAYDFSPHITLSTGDTMPPVDLIGRTVEFSHVRFAHGDDLYSLSLPNGPHETYQVENSVTGVLNTSVRKAAVPEKRFTLSPWYVPDTTDLHGEWTDQDTLQEAAWGYMDGGDRDIRLQHNDAVVAGRMVELVTWPYEVELEMVVPNADGTGLERRMVKLPAGTVFIGVIWEPWAYEMVRRGDLLGMSIGGRAARVDLPAPTTP